MLSHKKKSHTPRVLHVQQLEKRELFAADSGLWGALPGGTGESLPGLYSSTPSSKVPAPFWRKTDGVPSAAPAWYQNIGPVTREVFYDPSLTPAQNGAALKGLLTTLPAGSRVVIHAGTYSVDSYFVITAQGTASQPVVIEGAPGEKVSITRKDSLQNVINVDNSQYLLIRNLDVYGGDTGLKLQTASNFMLYDSKIHHGMGVGVAANSKNTSQLYFVDNEISYTGGHGEGFYLGSNDGVFKTNNSHVVGNYLHHLASDTAAQGDGIEIKDGSYANVVKYNFVDGTKYPGITVYRTGRGVADRNVIEENVVINSIDAGIQVTADAVVRNNLVIGKSTAFVSKPFTTNPVNLVVSNNTFLGGATTIKLTNWLTTDLAFANNAIHSPTGQFYSSSRTGQAVATGNINVSNLATSFTNLKLDGTGLNARPITGSVVIGRASSNYLPSGDLNGDTRITEMDTGAVDFAGDSTTVTGTLSTKSTVRNATPAPTLESKSTSSKENSTGAIQGSPLLRSSSPGASLAAQRFSVAAMVKAPNPKLIQSSQTTTSSSLSNDRSALQHERLLDQVVSELQSFA
ncbi:MAG: right-handed parallel beta-helix repeat-containing protein [Planctomycetota bacterium]|nr:right-handed parallel beta-helix repeat-containing protein [Planctomycetota bacterium]